MFLEFSYYFMHLFSSQVLGVSNCVSILKRQNGDGLVCLAGQSTNWHPYQIGGLSLLAINCSLFLMEDTITKWYSVRFLHETAYTRIL